MVVPKPQPKFTIIMTKKMELHKYQENIRDVLLNTNATPIRCRGGIGYTCCFCTDQYPEPMDLKKHTIAEHNAKDISEFAKGVTLHDFVVKLDITDLKCQCGVNLQNIDDLVDHLKDMHKIQFHANFSKHVVPFRFNDKLSCAVCSLVFNNFKVLLVHMNVHYRNHVCEVCGAGFINKRKLRGHRNRHSTGDFPCKVCSKVFDTRIKMTDHERAVHVYGNKRNKCGYCGDMFKDYTKKNDHEVRVHGARPVLLNCKACDRVFGNQRALTVHLKTYHMMQRKK